MRNLLATGGNKKQEEVSINIDYCLIKLPVCFVCIFSKIAQTIVIINNYTKKTFKTRRNSKNTQWISNT